MSDNRNIRRMLRWITFAGLLAGSVAIYATPAAADQQFNPQSRYWTDDQHGNWNHHRQREGHRRDYYDYGYDYRHHRERSRNYYAPMPYYNEAPSFSFGLTLPIH